MQPGWAGVTWRHDGRTRDHGAAVVVVNLHDGAYGQIDRQQKNLFGESYGCGFLSPDFARIAEACGGLGIRVERPGDLKDALREALRAPKPAIIDVITRDRPYPSWT